MLIYLTSEAAKTIDALIPFLPTSPQNLSVAFIPTASDMYIEKPWVDRDREKLLELGFTVEDVDLKSKTKEQLQQVLSNKDVIFVAGGNTSYLLEQAQISGFLEITQELVKKGKIYIGSSAGSLLAAPSIEVDKIYDDGEFGKVLESYEGLGLVDFVVLPHADNQKYASYLERIVKEYGDKHKLQKLNDNEAIVATEEEIKMIAV